MQEDFETITCQETLRKNNLIPIRKLGKGGFGTVYLVSRILGRKGEGELFAVKCTNKKNFAQQPLLYKYLRQEIDVHGSIQHPNIVRLIKSFDDNGWNFMVMEYCEMGNLSTIQSQKQTKKFELPQAKRLMLQILDGLLHLHSKSIIHRDLKPENILLSKLSNSNELLVKICDFGFAKETLQEASTFCGTPYFMAPEILAKKKYDDSVDVWAAGVIFFFMIFGILPFKSTNDKNLGLNMSGEIESKCKNGFDFMSIKGMDRFGYFNENMKILRRLFSEIFRLDSNKRIRICEFKRVLEKEISFKENDEQLSTIETDSDDEKEAIENVSQQIVFMQKVYQEVKNLEFLTEFEGIALKYYLDKYCLTLLLSIKTCVTNQTMLKMKNELLHNQKMESAVIFSNLSKIGIARLAKLFSGVKYTNFSDYKEEYRIVLSYCFSKASKIIKDTRLKSIIKLKLFCCHSINRVFDQQYIYGIFPHFFNSNKSKQYKIVHIMKWMDNENEEKINDTLRILCDRFYPKGK